MNESLNCLADASADRSVRNMQSLLTEITKELVDHPEAVRVEARIDGDQTTFLLSVAPTDLGKVIGKKGQTARSLRTIVTASSMKQRRNFHLAITEE